MSKIEFVDETAPQPVEEDAPVRSMPGDRSGTVLSRQQIAEKKREERKAKKQVQAETELKTKQQWAMEKLRNSNVTFEMMSGIVGELDQKILRLHLKTEAMILAQRKLDPTFSAVFEDSFQRIVKMREMVSNLNDLKLSLKEFADNITRWNADTENPPISYRAFDSGFLADILSKDQELTKDEKTVFLESFGVPEAGVLALLGPEIPPDEPPVPQEQVQ